MFIKVAQKVAKYLGNLSQKISCESFKKSPNLVTLEGRYVGSTPSPNAPKMKLTEQIFNFPSPAFC